MMRVYRLERISILFPMPPSKRGFLMGLIHADVEDDSDQITCALSRADDGDIQILHSMSLKNFRVHPALLSPEFRAELIEATKHELRKWGIDP
jgi:hypothetical protein